MDPSYAPMPALQCAVQHLLAHTGCVNNAWWQLFCWRTLPRWLCAPHQQLSHHTGTISSVGPSAAARPGLSGHHRYLPASLARALAIRGSCNLPWLLLLLLPLPPLLVPVPPACPAAAALSAQVPTGGCSSSPLRPPSSPRPPGGCGRALPKRLTAALVVLLLRLSGTPAPPLLSSPPSSPPWLPRLLPRHGWPLLGWLGAGGPNSQPPAVLGRLLPLLLPPSPSNAASAGPQPNKSGDASSAACWEGGRLASLGAPRGPSPNKLLPPGASTLLTLLEVLGRPVSHTLLAVVGRLLGAAALLGAPACPPFNNGLTSKPAMEPASPAMPSKLLLPSVSSPDLLPLGSA